MLIAAQRTNGVRAAVAGLGLAAVAAAAGLAIAQAPRLCLAVGIGAVALWVLLPRLTLVTGLLAACFFYDDFFVSRFPGFWNPGKLMGLIAVASFAYAWIVDRRPLVWARQLPVLLGLAASVAISYTFARDAVVAEEVAIRYLMFIVLFVVMLHAVRRRADADLIIDITVVAATAAAAVGLFLYFFAGVRRVAGPIADPGDFGFVLGSTVPLAIYRVAGARGAVRALRVISVLVILAAIIGTFARADVLGLAAAGAWVIATGRARMRWAVIAVVAVVLIGLAAYEARPDLVQTSLLQKQYVAQQNVDNRFGLWAVAVDQWQSSPLLGVGPGNYQARFLEFSPPSQLRVQTTHNAYLNVLAELGLFGLSLFVLYLAMSWDQLRRRARDRSEDWLRTALAAGFVLAIVGSMFMTQQFYPPVWFLAAMGAALDRIRA